MLISYQKPHKAVATDTLSRWLKEVHVLKQSGIQKFTGHSTRAASSPAAKRLNVDIATILQAAGWANASTFNRFYNKPLQTDDNFGQVLLDSCIQKNHWANIVLLLYTVKFYIILFVGFASLLVCFDPSPQARDPNTLKLSHDSLVM